MANEIPKLSPELEEAARQIPVLIDWIYDDVFTSLDQLMRTLIEAAERQGFALIR